MGKLFAAGLMAGVLSLRADSFDDKARELVAQLTLDEKLGMIHGNGFNIAPVKRLGILPINMSDASMVVQLYVADEECSVPRPPKELKGFEKVFRKAGESKTVEIDLDPSSFAFWHPARKEWTVEPGAFTLLAGSSSRDIRLRKTISIGEQGRFFQGGTETEKR